MPGDSTDSASILEHEYYDSDSLAVRQQRGASIRAGVVIASACGVRHAQGTGAGSTGPWANNGTQKRRIVMDCVLIIRRGSEFKRRKMDHSTHDKDIDSKDELSKIKLWKNPKVKKNEDLALLPDTIRSRIKHIGFEIQDQYVQLDRATCEVMVTREFMSAHYGGSPRATRPIVSKKFLDVHGMNDFYFINPDFDPQPPEVPGAPGLKLSTRAGPDKGRLRVLTKIKNTSAKHDNLYLYVGQYDVMRANPPSLSVQEWRAQSPKFHNKWAHGIVTMGWGQDVRCRILGRNLCGRQPTEDEVNEIRASKRYTEVTREEVKEAYFSGQEQMGVWTMKCVGYDNDFQRDLSVKFSTWVPPLRKGKHKGSTTDDKEDHSLLKIMTELRLSMFLLKWIVRWPSTVWSWTFHGSVVLPLWDTLPEWILCCRRWL